MKTKFLVKDEIEKKKEALVSIMRALQIMLVLSGAMITTFLVCASKAFRAGSMFLTTGFLICIAVAIGCVAAQFITSERTIKGCLDYIWHYCDIAFDSIRLKKELTLDEIIDEYEKHITRVD
jgi:hypothetical protein